MATKYDLKTIMQRAWWSARKNAELRSSFERRIVSARECFSGALKDAWASAKGAFFGRGVVSTTNPVSVPPRGAYATRAQISYIESLLGRGKGAPAGLTKAAASAMIDRLKARKGAGLQSEDPSFDYGWY